MFAEVVKNDLVVGVKYAIVMRYDACKYKTGVFKHHYNGLGGTSQWFYYMEEHSWSENIDTYMTLRNMQNKPIGYYAFVPQKEKIQQAMEQRALDKILRRLINDDFTW